MRVLIVTSDPTLTASFGETTSEFGIELQTNRDSQNFSESLRTTKYEGVFIDFDTVPAALPAVNDVRKSLGNHKAVIFAIASDSDRRDKALIAGAHFILQRPIQKLELADTLNAAYDLMQRERRRYFRSSAELSVSIKRIGSAQTVECSTMNVSSDGMGIKTPTMLTLAEAVDIRLPLPDGFIVRAIGIVIWGDQHGKAGIKFTCSTPEIRQKLDAWLNANFGQ
jgi:DNA-binding response OmpR family regulator